MTVSVENAQVPLMVAVLIALLGGLGLYEKRRAAHGRDTRR